MQDQVTVLLAENSRLERTNTCLERKVQLLTAEAANANKRVELLTHQKAVLQAQHSTNDTGNKGQKFVAHEEFDNDSFDSRDFSATSGLTIIEEESFDETEFEEDLSVLSEASFSVETGVCAIVLQRRRCDMLLIFRVIALLTDSSLPSYRKPVQSEPTHNGPQSSGSQRVSGVDTSSICECDMFGWNGPGHSPACDCWEPPVDSN